MNNNVVKTALYFVAVDVSVKDFCMDFQCWISDRAEWLRNNEQMPYQYDVLGDGFAAMVYSNTQLTNKVLAVVNEYIGAVVMTTPKRHALRPVVNRK